jgi:glucosamine--fructose-6-phosphate aminotransferase (isomerizing)
MEDRETTFPTGGNALTVTERAAQTLGIEIEDVSKGAYDTFMAKEIHEQPASLAQTIGGRLPSDGCGGYRARLGGLPRERVAEILGGRRIVLVACGTSYNAALSTRQLMERAARLPVSLELASDFVDRAPPVSADDVFVFVSQSGETADTLAALEHARSGGAACVGVTNVAGSTLSRTTDFGVHVNAGPEIGVASTKAFTSQIAVLVMIALALAEGRGSPDVDRDAVCAALRDLPAACAETLLLDGQVKRIAARIVDEPSLLVIGRGANFAVALEGALKTKEVALIHSESVLAGELKHGPLALVGETMPVVAIAPMDEMHQRMLSVIEQLVTRECACKLVVVCESGDRSMDQFESRGVELVRVPSAGHAALNPVVNVIPFQLLAYHLATVRGHDVDRPRNLAKSVTVSD